MPTAIELSSYIGEKLRISAFSGDASNNGLQFDAGTEVRKAVFGVDACQALFSAAADMDADFIFVHHGISWGGSLKRIRMPDAARISLLAANGMSLCAAHLPLDAHPELGHNAAIAEMLELKKREPFAEYGAFRIGFQGLLPKAMKLSDLAEKADSLLPAEGEYTLFGDMDQKISRVGIVSGGGAFPEAFTEMKEKKIDCLITGEFTHQAYHYALECGAAVLAMGHYRTEIPGVLKVMTDVQETFGLDCCFIELPTGL